MVLGWRGPRSLGMRVTATVGLAATLLGPLRMAYAIPTAVPQTGQPAAPQTASAAAKLPTDVPWALATPVSPARLHVLAGAVDEAGAWRLFDGRAATGLAANGQTVRLRLDLPRATYLDAVAVFGRASRRDAR